MRFSAYILFFSFSITFHCWTPIKFLRNIPAVSLLKLNSLSCYKHFFLLLLQLVTIFGWEKIGECRSCSGWSLAGLKAHAAKALFAQPFASRLYARMGSKSFSLNTLLLMENRLPVTQTMENSLKKNFLMLSSVLTIKFGGGVVVVRRGFAVTFEVLFVEFVVLSTIALR